MSFLQAKFGRLGSQAVFEAIDYKRRLLFYSYNEGLLLRWVLFKLNHVCFDAVTWSDFDIGRYQSAELIATRYRFLLFFLLLKLLYPSFSDNGFTAQHPKLLSESDCPFEHLASAN